MSRTKHHGDREKEKKFGKMWFWYRSTPSEWVNKKMTRPQRVKVRALLRGVVKDELDSSEVMFPLAKKPHIYFW